ncbi:hypothetical protein FACS1894184_17770 [Clostridia bacterium]|nr:hypothetical protein FACS1894184_17770 [Clostridia bacterium]
MGMGLVELYNKIPDPRRGYAIRYELGEVLVIATLAILCGMDTFTEMQMFGIEQESWLKKYLVLSNGIPSHDTFGDIFAMLEPLVFTEAFTLWTQGVRDKVDNEVVAIDGKSICASRDVPKKKKAVHVISAWACSNRLVLGELCTSEKNNEITAIPELLKALELKGCIVTIDAMGTQTKIAKAIIEQGAEYVLPVKGNQENMEKDIKLFFDNEPEISDRAQTQEKGHGRIETRECTISKDIEWLDPEKEWASLAGIAKITSHVTDLSTGKETSAEQYLIFSGEKFTAA